MMSELKRLFTYPGIKNFRKARAVISVFILWAVALSVLISVGIGYRAHMELRSFSFYKDQFYARHLKWTAFIQVLNILIEDSRSVDSLEEDWGRQAHIINDKYGSCSVTITDEERKLNINYSSKEVLGYFFSQELVDSILDWIDVDPDPRNYGAENINFYNFLEYPCRNSHIRSLYEIRYIKGGEDLSPEDFKGLFDYFTVYSDGKLNLNTVTEQCLDVLVVAGILLPRLSEKIINFRNLKGIFLENSSDYLNTVFKNAGLGELTADEVENWNQNINRFKVTSCYFKISIDAQTNKGIKSYAQAIVERKNGSFEILSWWENFWIE